MEWAIRTIGTTPRTTCKPWERLYVIPVAAPATYQNRKEVRQRTRCQPDGKPACRRRACRHTKVHILHPRCWPTTWPLSRCDGLTSLRAFLMNTGFRIPKKPRCRTKRSRRSSNEELLNRILYNLLVPVRRFGIECPEFASQRFAVPERALRPRQCCNDIRLLCPLGP